MPRSVPLVALLAFVVIGLLQAAPVPKKPAKDYQKLAEETEWQFPVHGFHDTLTTELSGYDVEEKGASGEETVAVRISKGGKHLATIDTHLQATLRQRDGVVYSTDFQPSSSGCAVVAFDLNAKKQLWKCDLKGLGGIVHSKYRNAVRMEVLDEDTLRVFGKESAGRYVEIVDRRTGKTVGHKLFDEKK